MFGYNEVNEPKILHVKSWCMNYIIITYLHELLALDTI